MAAPVRKISDEILRIMLEQASVSAWLIDADEKILFTNTAGAELTGYSLEELIGSPISMLMDAELRAVHADRVAEYAARGGDSGILGDVREFDLVRKDNSRLAIELVAFQMPKTLCGEPMFGAFVSDNTRHRDVEAKMARMARRDYLTGCMNRLGFMERAASELSRARRSGRPLSLLVMDLDHFKRINDTRGHLGGDAVLADLFPALTDALRAHDLIGRVGGEEFFVLLPETDCPEAEAVAERLRNALEAHAFYFNGTKIRLTASLGCASLRAGDDFDRLIHRADRRLYVAKRAGRNRVVSVDSDPAAEDAVAGETQPGE